MGHITKKINQTIKAKKTSNKPKKNQNKKNNYLCGISEGSKQLYGLH
jgi:hypothetical protein